MNLGFICIMIGNSIVTQRWRIAIGLMPRRNVPPGEYVWRWSWRWTPYRIIAAVRRPTDATSRRWTGRTTEIVRIAIIENSLQARLDL